MSVQQEKFKAIADKIREYTLDEELIKPNDFVEKIGRCHDIGLENGWSGGLNEGIEQGKQTAYDEFWDNYQKNGAYMDYYYAFGGSKWNNAILKPKHKIYPSSATQMFENCGCTDFDLTQLGVAFVWEHCSSFQSTFRNFKGLVNVGTIRITTYSSNADQMFYGCTGLTNVSMKVHAGLNFYNNAFYGCTSLTDLTIEGTIGKLINLQWSPLDKESIESVINSLSSTTSGLTATFNKSAKEAAFTDEEWIALITPKSNQYDGNWTISLV